MIAGLGCYVITWLPREARLEPEASVAFFPKKEPFQITSNVSGLNMVQWPLVGVVELELELELVGASIVGLSLS